MSSMSRSSGIQVAMRVAMSPHCHHRKTTVECSGQQIIKRKREFRDQPVLTPRPDHSPLYRIVPKSVTLPRFECRPLDGAFMVAAIA